jgi:hypothetical protein
MIAKMDGVHHFVARHHSTTEEKIRPGRAAFLLKGSATMAY